MSEVLGDEMFVWQLQLPDESWTTVAAMVPGTEQWAPLINRDRAVMEGLQWLAEMHADGWAKQQGLRSTPKLRLATFALSGAEVVN